MLRALSILLVAVSLSAHAAPAAPAADLTDPFRSLWDRFRGRKPPPQAPGGDGPIIGRLISWNVQTLGMKASKGKKDALRLGLGRALAGAGSSIFAAQEVANDKGAETLALQLPGEGHGWTMSFEDTSDSMNNAIFTGPGVRLNCSSNLNLEGVRHPPHMAHVTVGDADFTVLSVHLSYAKGDAAASADELKLIMEWVRAQAAKPGADPDFVIAGDFNLPTGKGKTLSSRSSDRSWEPIEEALGPGFTALVDEPTSRRGREDAANNYDHFLVSDDFLDEELVAAGAIDAAEFIMAERPAGARGSDHFPIALTFRKSGPGSDGAAVALDGPSTCR